MKFTPGAEPRGRPTVPRAPCWVCDVVAGSTAHGTHEVFHDDGDLVACLSPGAVPTGLALVIPHRHVGDFVDDMSVEEYLAAQELVHRVAAAVKRAVPVDCVVVSSMGGLPGTPHVLWNIMPMTVPSVGPDGSVAVPRYPEAEATDLAELAGHLRERLSPRKA